MRVLRPAACLHSPWVPLRRVHSPHHPDPRRSFAWADSLWFGEGFDYQGTSADWWLLEASGLPYGLTGDMIGACPPNRWLGMVFGASTLDLS